MVKKANANKKDDVKVVKNSSSKTSSNKKSTTTKKTEEKVVNKSTKAKTVTVVKKNNNKVVENKTAPIKKTATKKVEIKEDVISKDISPIDKYKGLLVAGGIIIFLILIFFLSGGEVNHTKSGNVTAIEFSDIGLDDYLDYKENSEMSIVYVGRPTCSYCALLEPILQEVGGQYNLDINYLNTDEFSEAEHQEFMNSYSYFAEGYGTPLVLLLQNGTIVDMIEGYVEEEVVVDFFTTNGLIEEVDDESIDADEVLNLITIDQYLSLKSGNDPAIIYVGRPTCSYCELLKPSLNMITSDYGVVINYLNTDSLSNSEHQQFIDSDSYFSEGYGTPLVLVVQNNEIVSMIEGYVEEDQVVSFFKNHGFIN